MIPHFRSKPLFLAAALLLAAFRVFAQEAAEEPSLDDLFMDAPEDVAAPAAPGTEAAAVDHTLAFTTAEKIKLSGSFSAEGGVALGWTKWPELSDPETHLVGTVGGKATNTLSFDARPDEYLRIFSSFKYTLDPAENDDFSWSDLNIAEMYADYYGVPSAFLRLGKFTQTWGQGRLFTPGDLMEDNEDGTAVRVSFPALLSGISATALAKKEFFHDPKDPSYREFAYGASADAVVRSIRLTLAGRYQKNEGYRLLASVKRTILGVDLFADGVYKDPGFIFLAGFYKDWKDLRLYGEYQYDDGAADDHSFGLATLYKRAFGSPVDLGVKWMHTSQDGSGSLTLGAVFSPWPRLSLGAAVPIHYGATGSKYVIDNEDPAGRRIALALTAKISGTF